VQRVLWWLLGLTGVVAVGIAAALDQVHGGARDMSTLQLSLTCLAVVVSAVLGVRVLDRDRAQRMGWLLVYMGLVGGLLTLAEVYAFDALVRHAGPTWGASAADAVSESSWVVAYAALSVVALLFPTGRWHAPGWRWLAAACCVAFPVAAFMVPVQPGAQDDPFVSVTNPVGLSWVGSAAGQLVTGLVMVISLGCMAGCVAALLDRYAGSRGLERQQITALLYAAALTPIALLVCLATRSDSLASVLLPLALASVSLAVGLAVLRYRLYDVERLVNRTAVYAVLTAGLAATYVAISSIVALLAPGTAATAIGTAFAVLAFRPVRDFAQDQIDRRFARSSARARALLKELTDDLRHGRRTPDALRDVLAAAFDDPELSLRFHLEHQNGYVDGTGALCAGSDLGWCELGDSGVQVRSLAVFPGLLLATVLNGGALALELARLHAAVCAQAAFVAAAHIRIAAAGYEERRRMERDLHDGAQQRLLSLGLQLRRVQRALPPQTAIVAPALDDAVEEIGRTLAELRRLANGDGPTSLEHGLATALAELAAGLPVPLHVELPDQRLPQRVEAAAYFVACEAVTNAVKHAGASRIQLQANVVEGALHVVVTDDGRGGAVAAGSGLSGLADRVRSHGGTLLLKSPPGAGTTLRVVIPCGL